MLEVRGIPDVVVAAVTLAAAPHPDPLPARTGRGNSRGFVRQRFVRILVICVDRPRRIVRTVRHK
jgi:hypothetical protein